MRVIIEPDYASMSKWAANYVANRIKAANPTKENPFKLGCPTGSSPLGLYQELINKYKAGEISFQNVITFNMDEYVNLSEEHPESYHSFMWTNFFSYIDIKADNVHILNGNSKDLVRECEDYEKAIMDAGGIDLFMGGIGPDGHLAFNEPGSSLASKTRIKTLTTDTIHANSRFFDGNLSLVPKQALTVGIGTVMEAREVLLVCNGHKKARALKHCIDGNISHKWTSSMLQMHPRAIVVCDEAACDELSVGTYKYYLDKERGNL
ncbi:MAG: glucosamine-6-phosphate deaminase [Bacteroidales bacterium]|nr:glucosamine-6-phosphate deaminase [Bacteroidales bacterium]